MNKPVDDWWSGAFYEKWIDPRTQELREVISEQINKGSSVIDIGCGTGALAFELAKKCSRVVGVDLSPKMIQHANKRKEENTSSNIDFREADGTNLTEFGDQEFDFATISMVLHEIPRELAIAILKEMNRVAKKIVIADYITKQPINLPGIRIRLAELFAGIEHFKNFRAYSKIMD